MPGGLSGPAQPALLPAGRRGHQGGPATRSRRMVHDGRGRAWPFLNSAWFARRALMDLTVSCGQAFGGDLEAVTLHSGLLAARLVGEADVAIVGIGPGVVGTGTVPSTGIAQERRPSTNVGRCGRTTGAGAAPTVRGRAGAPPSGEPSHAHRPDRVSRSFPRVGGPGASVGRPACTIESALRCGGVEAPHARRRGRRLPAVFFRGCPMGVSASLGGGAKAAGRESRT